MGILCLSGVVTFDVVAQEKPDACKALSDESKECFYNGDGECECVWKVDTKGLNKDDE